MVRVCSLTVDVSSFHLIPLNTHLKHSLDQVPFPSTPIASHKHRQRLNIYSLAIRFRGALSEYGRPPLRELDENALGGRMADGGKNKAWGR